LTTLAASWPTSAWHRAAWLSAGLGAAALARSAFIGIGTPGAFLIGTVFGLTLLGIALAAGWRPALPRLGSLGVGIVGGLILIVIPELVGPSSRAVFGIRPDPFFAWVAVTALVVAAEEALLRGALLSALDAAGGPAVAVIGSSIAFALMHVPVYGWGVVPIDLAAGAFLAGLRYLTGGTAAPTMAHLVADMATWWL
jgi:membrane protease YdiL (CAAX protease family)